MLTFMVSSCQDLFPFVISSFRWCFQTFFYVHPYLGKIPILTNIFQMGWNHHLVIFWVSDFPIDRHGCTWMCVKDRPFLISTFILKTLDSWKIWLVSSPLQYAIRLHSTPATQQHGLGNTHCPQVVEDPDALQYASEKLRTCREVPSDASNGSSMRW